MVNTLFYFGETAKWQSVGVKVSWANDSGILEGVIAAALPGAAGVVGPCSFLFFGGGFQVVTTHNPVYL